MYRNKTAAERGLAQEKDPKSGGTLWRLKKPAKQENST